MKWIEARYILAAFVSTLVILSALASGVGGTAGVSLYMALFFFERYPAARSLTLIAVYVTQRYSPLASSD
jgi:hypothetical protein